MGEKPETAKPDGSAWKTHMQEVTARNDAARKAGRQQRAEQERSQAQVQRAVELRQAAERRRRIGEADGAASLLRGNGG